jgi:hypothetical protein
VAHETFHEEMARLSTLVPTAATIAAVAIAFALLLNAGGSGRRGAGDRPEAPASRAEKAPGSDEFVWYVVDAPAKGRLLREALALSQRAPIHGDVLVITSAEDETFVGSAIAELANVRVSQALPEARIVDLRSD